MVQYSSQQHATNECEWRMNLSATQLSNQHLVDLHNEMELYSSTAAPSFLDMDAAATVLAVALLLGAVLSLVMQTVGISSASAAVIPMAAPAHAWTRAVTAMAPAAAAQPRAALDAVPSGWCVAAVLAAFILGVAVGWAALRWASSLSRSRSSAAMAARTQRHKLRSLPIVNVLSRARTPMWLR